MRVEIRCEVYRFERKSVTLYLFQASGETPEISR